MLLTADYVITQKTMPPRKSEENLMIKGTLIKIWKSANIFGFIWKQYVENFALKHLFLFEICARDICEKFVCKPWETIEDVIN